VLLGETLPPLPTFHPNMSELIRFLRQNDLPTILAAFKSKDAHPFVQFVKYGFCGVAATLVHVTVYLLLTKFFWEDKKDGSVANALNTLPPTLIAFLFSNLAAYLLNKQFVFTQGRHSQWKEFLLFTVVNLPGLVGGAIVQAALVQYAGWSKPMAVIGFIAPNILINFLCRKFFIFSK
jgi:putative flippase GtrA